ncbi:hypothetical protein, partial [uncultured Campylobacter sp.]|uniref:hypothetical protein n=1 Tax=uncultured Campylobacter sp. TaxID=218934 RepID=UPI00260FE3E0
MEFIADESNGGYRGQTKEWIKLELINGAVSRKYYKALQGAYLVPLGGKKPGHNRKPVGQSYDTYALGDYRIYLDDQKFVPFYNDNSIIDFVSIQAYPDRKQQYHDTYDVRDDELLIFCDDGKKIRVKEMFRFALSRELYFAVPNSDGSKTKTTPFLDFANKRGKSDYFKTVKNMLNEYRLFFCQNPQGKSEKHIKNAFGFERAKRALKKKFLAAVSLHSVWKGEDVFKGPALP